MRNFFLLSALWICSFAVQAQDTLDFYFNSKWEKEPEKEKAVYYRRAVLKSGVWEVSDYYFKNMKLQMTGTYTSLEKEEKQGMFVFYYENGNKEKEGRYYSDYKMGLWQTWYENGTLRSRENYITRDGMVDTLIKEGVVSLGGNIMDVMYIARQKCVFEGKSEWFYPNGQISSEEYWNIRLLSMKHWNEKGKKVPVDKNRPTPFFPAGVAELPFCDMRTFIEEVGKKNIEGKVVLEMGIDTEGRVESIDVRTSSGDINVDREIVKLLGYHNPVWTPGRIHNLPERMTVSLPLRFR